MGRHTIKMTLSQTSIQNAIKELRQYQNRLQEKTKEFVRELGNVGIPVVDKNMADANFTYGSNGIVSGSDTSHTAVVNVTNNGFVARADLVVSGKELMFIEFGAGVYYNGAAGSSPHPKGQEFGMVIGSYGLGNGQKTVWGYYDKDGELVLTHGTKATMPVYKAELEMIRKYVSVAKKVFK